jgi:hypothetical protein
MLSNESINKIASLLKLNAEEFTSILKDAEEKSIQIPDGIQVFSKSELDTRDEAKTKSAYSDGKLAGEQMAVKAMKEKYGLNYEGSKDIDVLMEKFKEKLESESKKTPAEHETTIIQLRKSVEEYSAKATEWETKYNDLNITQKVFSVMPEPTNGLTKAEAFTVLKANGYEVVDANGQIQLKHNGNIVSDEKLATPLSADVAFKNIFETKGWYKPAEPAASGRGGGSSNPAQGAGIPSKLSEAEAKWKAEGKSTNGSEFATHIQSLAKENPSFDMNS